LGLIGNFARTAVALALSNDRISAWILSNLASQGYLLYKDFADHKLVFNAAEAMGRRVYNHGHFHRDVTEAVFAIANELQPNGAMLDVGANFGTQSVYAQLCHCFSSVISVEPDPSNFRLLRANAAMNAENLEIELHEVAFSNREGTARMQVSPYHSGASTLEALTDQQSGGTKTYIDIDTVRGADLLNDIGVSPHEISLIWMDVEKHEAAALEGMSEMLEDHPTLYFEYTYEQPSQDSIDTIDRLVFSSYPHLYLETRSLVPVTRDEILEFTRTQTGHVNILATKLPVLSERFERALSENAPSSL